MRVPSSVDVGDTFPVGGFVVDLMFLTFWSVDGTAFGVSMSSLPTWSAEAPKAV